MSTGQDIEVQFAVPAMDVQTGTYGKVVLTAVLQTVPAETVIYNEELRQYIENIKYEMSQSVQDITQSLSVDVTGRLGYRFSVNSQAGSSYTLVLEDEGTLVRMTSSQENQLIIPDEATVPFEVGTIVNVRRAGAGETTIVPAEGVTVNTPDIGMKIDDMNLGVGLVKVGPDTWDLVKSFTGVPMGEVEQLVEDIDFAIQSLETAQTALDDKVAQLNQSLDATIARIEKQLTDSVDAAVQKAETAIANLGDVTTVGDFTNIKNSNGFLNLPNGLVIQWGIALVAPFGADIIPFPKPFSKECLWASAGSAPHSRYLSDSRKRQQTVGVVEKWTKDNVTLWNMRAGDDTSGDLETIKIYWFAIGH